METIVRDLMTSPAVTCAAEDSLAAAARSPSMFVTFTLIYAFVQGLNYASFSAVVLEAIGGGAAATKYNLYASLANMPIAYLVIVDGLGVRKCDGLDAALQARKAILDRMNGVS